MNPPAGPEKASARRAAADQDAASAARSDGAADSERGRHLVVVSGPSGVGKSTVVRTLRQRMPDLGFSVSCTTRARRKGEAAGADYYFLTRDQFQGRIDQGRFIEYAEVFGDLYGTPVGELEKLSRAGRLLLLDIDVQGGVQVRAKYPEALLVLLTAPSLEEIRRRLSGRGTESADVVQRRFAKAQQELQMARRSGAYNHEVVNDTVDRAVDEIRKLIQQHRRHIA